MVSEPQIWKFLTLKKRRLYRINSLSNFREHHSRCLQKFYIAVHLSNLLLMVIVFRWRVWGAWSISIHLLKGCRLALGWEDRHSALLQRTQRSQRKRRSWLWEIVSLTPQSHIFHGGYYCLKLQFGLLSYVTFVTTGVPLSYSLGCQHTTIRWELLPFVYAMLGCYKNCSWWFLRWCIWHPCQN